MRVKNQKSFLRTVVVFHALLLTFLLVMSNVAHAMQSEWAVSDNVRARLLSGVKSVGEDTQIQAALEIDLSEGWHTYWKHAGDSGLPMRFNWEDSKNVKEVEVSYPVPIRKTELDILTVYAYDGRIILPMMIDLEAANTDTTLDLEIQLMVCNEICIPDKLDVFLELDSGSGKDAPQLKIIDAAKRKIPYKLGESTTNTDLYIDTIVTGADAIVVNAHMNRGIDDALVIAHTDEFALTTKPQFVPDPNDASSVMITVPKPEDIENMMQFLNGKTLTLVLSDGREAVEKSIEF